MAEPNTNIFRDIFYSIAEQTQIKAKLADKYVSKTENGKIKHEATRGSLKEAAIIEGLSQILPSGYGFSSGFVVDSLQHVSPQIDLLIYDKNELPVAFLHKDNAVIPIESFKTAIEVKSTLTTNNFEQIGKQIDSLESMMCTLFLPKGGKILESRRINYKKPLQSIFIICFDSTVNKEKLRKTVRESNFITGIFVLNKYLIKHDGEAENVDESQVERTLMAFLHIYHHITGLVGYEKSLQNEIIQKVSQLMPGLDVNDPQVKLRLTTPTLVAYLDKNFHSDKA